MKRPLPAFLGFSRRYNHSCIRNCNPKTSHDFRKCIVADSIIENVRIYIVGFSDTRHTDCMRAYAAKRFHMLRVHNDSGKVIAVIIQPEQHANPHIVNSGFSRPIHSFRMIGVIAFRAGWMKVFIRFLIISFLKQNISSNSSFL